VEADEGVGRLLEQVVVLQDQLPSNPVVHIIWLGQVDLPLELKLRAKTNHQLPPRPPLFSSERYVEAFKPKLTLISEF
jgi:hypothetical protein